MQRISRALISVSDKTGVVELARALQDEGVEIIASDGTAEYLKQHLINVLSVSQVTGAKELLDGKVKTIHPTIYAAILVNRGVQSEMDSLGGVAPIDAVIVNLYPHPGFDIGGPTLIRAGAKNAEYVSVISNPNQYPRFIELLADGITSEQRRQWAHEALVMTATYDLSLAGERGEPLRYGENPHQTASLLRSSSHNGVAGARIIQGKEMSLNNYADLDVAWKIVMDQPNSVSIIKHGIPSGVACEKNPEIAYRLALASDPDSAFGGVIAFRNQIDLGAAEAIIERFTEVVAAPSFTSDALSVFATKPNIRILEISANAQSKNHVISIDGGYLLQEQDSINGENDVAQSWKLVAGTKATPEELKNLEFAWKVVARTRSNAIVIAQNLATIGIGAGNVNRRDAATAAVNRAKNHQPSLLKGSVAASDAFFPFPDGLHLLIDAGIRAVVQPGGSINDEAVIEAAKRAGISLYLTGIRHFSH